MIYEFKAWLAELLLEAAFIISPREICKTNMAKAIELYCQLTIKELESDDREET